MEFARCEALRCISIPVSIRVIGDGVFSGGYNSPSRLENITIPANFQFLK